MRRRPFCLIMLALLLDCPLAMAADPPPIDGGGVMGLDLRTQLETGLMARRPEEFEYIGQIIELVEEGKLPRSLVTSTFAWAKQKPVRKLQYFQFALQARARHLPVQLPDLRKLAVGIRTGGG
ncbi:MAG: hypothetical protein WD063_04575 [Pirellulales bacterium]